MEHPDIVPSERIADKIHVIRARKVMLDRDLAQLYGVKTHVLNQAVRRHSERFPEDFMFKLGQDEHKNLISQIVISKSPIEERDFLKSQIVTSKDGRGGVRKLPLAFTEQGIAMLSGVLNSPRAIAVNIQIIRTFTKLRELLSENEQLRLKIEAMERSYDKQFKVVFDAIRQLLAEPSSEEKPIGFEP